MLNILRTRLSILKQITYIESVKCSLSTVKIKKKKYLKKKQQKFNFLNFLPETIGSDGGCSLDRGAPEKRDIIIAESFRHLSLAVFEKPSRHI